MGGGGGVEVALFREVLGNTSGEGVMALDTELACTAGDLVVAMLVGRPEGVIGVEGSDTCDEVAIGRTSAHGR